MGRGVKAAMPCEVDLAEQTDVICFVRDVIPMRE
jgi:hypothetical protein